MRNNPILLQLLFVTTCLAGCDGVVESHEHTFKQEWETNETHHWHNASCEHTNLVKDLNTHIFGDNNVCSDCGYTKPAPVVEHEHTFATSWTHDETNHWHAATCEHTELTSGLAAHKYGDDNICDDCGYEKPAPVVEHEHTFATSWTHDETNHWHQATCEHTDLTSGLEAHDFGDGSVCKDCGYEKPAPVIPHEHTFAAGWTYDETNHWHAATCEHTDLSSGLAAHNFNGDDECDDCGYTKPSPAHEHSFATVWSHDETNHWHAATCEHTDLTSGLEAHDFGDGNVCEDCGYEKPEPVHTHTFSTDWSNNENQHWHASTCGHDYTESLGNHTYNVDNICTVCGFKKIEKHTITYVGWPDGIENPNPEEFIRTDDFILDGSPINAKEGLINAKFFVDSVEVTTLTGIDKDVTVSVTYDASTTTITFDPNNGEDESVIVDAPYWSIPSELIDEYTRENHSLLGWFKDNGDEVDINEHWIGTETTLNLTAKWKFNSIDQYIKNVEDFEKDLIVQLGQLAPMGDLFPTAVRNLDGLLDLARKELLIKDYTKEEADVVYKKHTTELNKEAVSNCNGPLSIALKAAYDKRKNELNAIDASRIPYLDTVYYSYVGFANPEKPLKEVIQSWRAGVTSIEMFF